VNLLLDFHWVFEYKIILFPSPKVLKSSKKKLFLLFTSQHEVGDGLLVNLETIIYIQFHVVAYDKIKLNL